MTADRLRRVLARICSAATLDRIVDPILADMRWERGRPSWLGYLALVKALAVHSILSVPDAVGRACRDDDHAVPKLAALVVVVGGVSAIPLIALPLSSTLTHVSTPALIGIMLRLLPQALALTLPAALLLAVPLALGRRGVSRAQARRTMVVSVFCVAATFAVMWILPEANQSFRVAVSGNPNVARGPSEWGFATLREQIDVLNFTHDRMTPEGRVLSRQLEYLYQVRVALICAPVPVCLLALGVAASRAGRRRPLVTGIVALGLYVPWLFALSEATTASLKRFDAVPPHVYAWAPMLMIGAAGIWLIARHPPSDARPPITVAR